MTHFVDRDLVNRLFAKFAIKYGKLWSTRLGDDGDWAACVDDWLEELSKFSFEQVRIAVNKALAIYRDFPPTQGQLIDLCLAESGVPDVQQLINFMVKREFNHPVVKMVYDKIGHWTLSNGKDLEIQKKAKDAYNECVAEFQLDSQSCWQKLTAYNEKTKELPSPPKIPNNQERRGFKERMTEYHQKLEEKKIDFKGKTFQEFDSNAINPMHRDFDKAIYNAYREYLLSIPDSEIMILPSHYMYARMRFIGQKEQQDSLRQAGYILPKDREGFQKESTRNGKPTQAYKTWVKD